MAFVLDCSVTMAWIFPDEATAATDRLRDALLELVLMEGSTCDSLSVAARAIGVAPATAPPAERRLGTPRRV